VEKKLGREMENILEKLEKVKREITEEIKELRKENQDVKREIEQLREEFKNKEKKWEEEKNSMSERVAWLETKMENEERRRRKNNIEITGWRSEGSSKQQSREEVEKFIKENIGEAKVKDCYNINKDQILVQMEEWSGKEKVMKQKGKLRGNRATEKIFIDNDLTKKEREIQKKYEPSPEKKGDKGKI
jgi:predicted RNase H-like nuclease (RuvC/YqgF family)